MSFDKNILFNVTHSTDIQNEEIISIVPNPARTYIDINLKNKNQSIQDISCFSNDGALLFNYKFSKNLSLSICRFTNYLVEIKSDLS